MDFLDDMIGQWAGENPSLNTTTLNIATRIRRLATYLEKRTDRALAPLGLTLWQLEVLAALQPAEDGLLVHQLLPAALLSPAAMTHRLDRLQSAGWIERIPSPSDRRATRIRLTPAGRQLTRRALAVHSAQSASSLAPLSPAQARELLQSLRTLLHHLCQSECAKNLRPSDD